MATISEIDGAIASARATAEAALNEVRAATANLTAWLDDFTLIPLGFGEVSPQLSDIGVIDAQDKPGALDLSGMDDGPEFVAPQLTSIDPLDSANIPELRADPPNIQSHVAPSAYTPGSLPNAPSLSDVTLPAAPDETLPEVPSFDTFVLPEPPELTKIEAPTMEMPTFDATAPEPKIAFTEQEYESELKDAAEAWLANVIKNGGTGLAEAVEQAIWNRGMTREIIAARRNLEAAIDEFAASGFPAPPGAVHARTMAIREDIQNRAEDLSRKIMEEQARLAQANTHFGVEQGIGFVAMEMEHTRAIMERAFQLAKATADLSLSVYNAKITAFNGRLDAYRTQAQVYEINVRAALQDIENYKALLEGKRLEASLRQDEVALYRAQVEGVKALFSLYRDKLEGSLAQIQADRGKIDLFRAQLEGETMKISAKEAEYNLYRAKLSGEKDKVAIYQAQVDAYNAQVRGAVAAFEAKKAQYDSALKNNALKIDGYKAEVDFKKALATYNNQRIIARIEEYKANNDTYRAQIAKAEAENRVRVEELRIDTERAKFNMAEFNDRTQLQAQLLLRAAEMKTGGYSQVASTAGAYAAAALSQINAVLSNMHSTEESVE
jgi:hypothetical protein